MPPNEVETVGHPESQYGDQIHRLNRILPDEIPFTLPADQGVRSAVAKLTELGISQAPVIVGGQILGVFTLRRLTRELLQVS